jgi:hypothetical protein
MRRAVQHLAAERADIVIPDYGTTLTDMAKRMGAISESLKGMAGHPAMQMTPDSIGAIGSSPQQNQRGDRSRQDQPGAGRLAPCSPGMRSVTAHARTAAEQRQQLYQVAGGHCWRVSCYGPSFPAPLPAPCRKAGTGPSAWPPDGGASSLGRGRTV